MLKHEPFYNPLNSYGDNYNNGPYGVFADAKKVKRAGEPQETFLGQRLYQPFGIPAGPLINGNFIKAAFDKGFDLCVYKTVRSKIFHSHQWPNILSVHTDGDLTSDKFNNTFTADKNFISPLSITNSFGVPSLDPDIWQIDMSTAISYAQKGQVLIGSFQGTKRKAHDREGFIADFVTTARLVKETGVKVIEVNLSCPNEGTAELVCFDTELVRDIVIRVKEEIGNTPLIGKIAYFEDDNRLKKIVTEVGNIIDAFSTVNTIPAYIVDSHGKPALKGKKRKISGVCGDAIRWAGLEMVVRLASLRQELKMSFSVIGVGGVMKPEHYQAYRKAGANAVMSATGAMWNPYLAQQIWEATHSK